MSSADHNAAILEAAGRYIGLEEYPGARSNVEVERLWVQAGMPAQSDDVPWCAVFVGAVLGEVGLPNTGKPNARSYLGWGVKVPLRDVRPGDVVVFWRNSPQSWQGHVGFVVGFDGDQVIVRGGNQSNRVSDDRYPVAKVLGFRRAAAEDPVTRRPMLERGDHGAFVLDLQKQLADLGFHSGALDGHFGPMTEAAVRAFQAHAKIAVDGIVGRETWGALREAVPRPERQVDEAQLRKRGSRNIAEADDGRKKLRQGAGAVAGVAVVDTALEAAEKVEESRGTLETVSAVLADNWPVLLILVLGVVIWRYGDRLTARWRELRVEAARTYRDLGR